ncbi:kynureninase [Nocardioides sp. CER19]|uniref:kynureninase n=1 Tax=Nocardioides sp. CER19 TaxID=3038538 RepID=UPI00244D1B3A|nr:kynureninase [Nocardioides sp. CER19]MDH2415030.1 kynureninase [Nocardioides sp. CER19]
MTTREETEKLDEQDPLAPLRDLFDLPVGTIYLDGNSLGALPRATAARVQQVVAEEWGRDLIGSWNSAGWIDLPHRVGDKIARLVGAGPGELVVADSTSVNVYKVLKAALAIAAEEAPERTVIVSERTNFPTDLYVAQSVAREHGCELVLIDPGEDPADRLDERVAVLLLTHVNYRTGAMWDLAAVTEQAHARGVLTVWDLCHSAGAVPVDLTGAGADFAIGCGYKFLNGGPGAPAYVWVSPRHADRFAQPLSGWMGHAAPFAFTTDYEPAPGIGRYVSGTPGVLATAALECGVDTLLAAEPYGGLAALRRKSLELTRLFADLVEDRVGGFDLESPRDDDARGSQVCLTRTEGAYEIVQALIARGVIGDFRAGQDGLPDILRFGVTPLYTRFVDVWDAVEHLRQVMESDEWRDERWAQRLAVT